MIFKIHPDFPNYRIYEDGSVYSLYRKRNKLFEIDKDGYQKVQLIEGNKRKKFFVHRLVSLLFIKNPNNLPVVNHKDGDKTNNHFSNLEWCTYSYNNRHAYSVGLKSAKGEKNRQAKLSKKEVSYIIDIYHQSDLPQWKVAEMFGISQQHVSGLVNGKYWKDDEGEDNA
jgi:predicted XRE-type DNA-binding protein